MAVLAHSCIICNCFPFCNCIVSCNFTFCLAKFSHFWLLFSSVPNVAKKIQLLLVRGWTEALSYQHSCTFLLLGNAVHFLKLVLGSNSDCFMSGGVRISICVGEKCWLCYIMSHCDSGTVRGASQLIASWVDDGIAAGIYDMWLVYVLYTWPRSGVGIPYSICPPPLWGCPHLLAAKKKNLKELKYVK